MPDLDYRLYPDLETDWRGRFFDGQFLYAEDFVEEQRYHVDRLRRTLGLVATAGVVVGLELTSPGAWSLNLAAGTAVDDLGRLLVVPTARTGLAVPNNLASSTVDVSLYYAEATARNQDQGGIQGPTRWREVPTLDFHPTNAPSGKPGAVRIGRITLDGAGMVTISDDVTLRTAVGLRLPVSNSTPIGGLTVTGASTLSGALAVTDATTLGGSLAVAGATSLSGGLAVTGATTLSGTLAVSGANATTLGGSLAVAGATTLSSGLAVTGATTLSGTLAVSGATTLSGTLTVSGTKATNLGGTLTVAGATTLNGTLSVGGTNATTLGGALTVAGATTLNGTLSVGGTNATTLGGALTVTGATTLKSTLTLTGTGATNLGGALTVAGALTVTGATTLNSTLTLAGTGATNLGGALTVAGALTVTGATTLNSTLTLAGTGATNLGGALTVTGAATLNNGLTLAGLLSAPGGISIGASGTLQYSGTVRQLINLWNAEAGLGVQNGGVTYFRALTNFAFFNGGVHNDATFNPGGGTVPMVIAGGNVGIGTTAPGSRLQVEGTTQLNGTLTAAGTGGIVLPGAGGIALNGAGAISFGTTKRTMLSLAEGTNYGIGIQDSTLYLRSATNFAFYQGGTHNDAQLNPGGGAVALAIVGSNVGLGTASPGSNRLQVEGAARVNGALTVTGALTGAGATLTSLSVSGSTALTSVTVTGAFSIDNLAADKGIKANHISIGRADQGALAYPYETLQLPTGDNLRVCFGSTERFFIGNDADVKIRFDGGMWRFHPDGRFYKCKTDGTVLQTVSPAGWT